MVERVESFSVIVPLSQATGMKCVYVIFVTGLCSTLSCIALEEWDYHDTYAADLTVNDDYSIIYSPIFPGQYLNEDNIIVKDDDAETPKNDLDENTIPASPNKPPVTDDHTETASSKENSAIEKLNAQVDKLMSEVKAQQDKIAELENVNKKLQSKVDFVEEQTKTNSLIFFNVHEGIRENHRMTLSKVLYVINKLMKVRLGPNDISVALRASFSESSNLTQHRPILVRMAKFVDKMRVVAASGRLSDTHITVAVDYSERVAQVRRQLMPFLAEAREGGRRAFMLYDTLMVDGERLTLEQLQTASKASGASCLEEVEEMEAAPPQPEPLGDYSL